MLITRERLAQSAYWRWKEQFCQNGEWSELNEDAEEIYNQLEKLSLDPTPQEVNAIIGHDSWTACPECSECGIQKDAVIRLREDRDSENYSPGAYLCRECTEKFVERWEAYDYQQSRMQARKHAAQA